MPIVVNTNAAASQAAFNLSKNHANLSKSLARLSSGSRITQPAEDAGLAVAYKLDSTMKRTEAVLNNHQNALSYLQVQDGALESVGSIVSRMAEFAPWLLTLLKTPAMLRITPKSSGSYRFSSIKSRSKSSMELAYLQAIVQ